eukprot:2609495-Pleurochrysis_carterae.AAC.1
MQRPRCDLRGAASRTAVRRMCADASVQTCVCARVPSCAKSRVADLRDAGGLPFDGTHADERHVRPEHVVHQDHVELLEDQVKARVPKLEQLSREPTGGEK